MEALSPDMRATVVLHHVEGLDAADVADALGISTNTVWTRLHRARALIRWALEGES
jgi:DNA-directed RNA polymerase specialized sigma24 family protein